MANDKLAELLKTQKSLTEWLQDIRHTDAEALRREDNDKRERLALLHQAIGLPYDAPTQFEATDLSEGSPALQDFVAAHGDELCALRLIPKDPALPKLRIRGKTIRDSYDWFKEQDIDPVQYRADFIPHPPDDTWGTIFVVNRHGIHGEIIAGGHHQLTQGFHFDGTPRVFNFDFDSWTMSPSDPAALACMQETVKYLQVGDEAVRNRLQQELDARFSHGYLEGYFETTHSSEGMYFIDYNRTLGGLFADTVILPHAPAAASLTSGQTGSPGRATGPVRIVTPADLQADFPEGAILVCPVTSPDYVPLMQKAAAIVTDQGGILSHASIVARELHKPCIVGTGNATAVLQDGQPVTVDADAGQVIAADQS